MKALYSSSRSGLQSDSSQASVQCPVPCPLQKGVYNHLQGKQRQKASRSAQAQRGIESCSWLDSMLNCEVCFQASCKGNILGAKSCPHSWLSGGRNTALAPMMRLFGCIRSIREPLGSHFPDHSQGGLLVMPCMRERHLFLAWDRTGWKEGKSRVKSQGPSSAAASSCPSVLACTLPLLS